MVIKSSCLNCVLPDPFTLDTGWLNEEAGISRWPHLYFMDIAQYLETKMTTELHHRLLNEYKQGKAYRSVEKEVYKSV